MELARKDKKKDSKGSIVRACFHGVINIHDEITIKH